MTAEEKPKNKGGRPKGIKETRPRLKRSDLLNANREDWAKWSRDGLLKKVRVRLAKIIESSGSSDKDAITAAKLLMEYDIGRPTEARDQPVSQPLNIFLTAPDGSYTKLSEARKKIDMEVRDAGER